MNVNESIKTGNIVAPVIGEQAAILCVVATEIYTAPAGLAIAEAPRLAAIVPAGGLVVAMSPEMVDKLTKAGVIKLDGIPNPNALKLV